MIASEGGFCLVVLVMAELFKLDVNGLTVDKINV
jgi:hypothetical protein